MWFCSWAWALPSIDEPVRTAVRSTGDSAVIVGIEDYFVLPDVPYAERDASAFYDFAVYTRGIPPERVSRLVGPVSRERLVAAIDEAGARTGPEGTVFVYFAGHGAASPSTGERMVLGADAQADLATFEARGVAVAELGRRAAAGGGNALVVLDTCFSGRTRGGDALVEGKRFAVPAGASAPPERVVEWAAAGADQWSSPLEEARHGAFTYLAIGALRGWADGERTGERDGVVTLEEASLYVDRGLSALALHDQRPEVVGGADLSLSRGTEPAPELLVTEPSVLPPTEGGPNGFVRWATRAPPPWFGGLEFAGFGSFDHSAKVRAGGSGDEYVELSDGGALSLAGYLHPASLLSVGVRFGLTTHSVRRSIGSEFYDRDQTVEPVGALMARPRLPGFPRVAGVVDLGLQRLGRVPGGTGTDGRGDAQVEVELPSFSARALPFLRVGGAFDFAHARPSGLSAGCAAQIALGVPALVSSPGEGVAPECFLTVTLAEPGGAR
ncbi:MAG: hypothetical protein ABMA64_23520 [Myxococcota bacterium]